MRVSTQIQVHFEKDECEQSALSYMDTHKANNYKKDCPSFLLLFLQGVVLLFYRSPMKMYVQLLFFTTLLYVIF